MIQIYTDGSCSGNPGVGGWAAITVKNDEVLSQDRGGELETTNNRMELLAIIKAMEIVVERNATAEILSDSAYVVNAIKDKWIEKWMFNGWKTKRGQDVKNRDLWEKFIEKRKQIKSLGIKVRFVKVKGHNGIKYNELADKNAALGSAEAHLEV